EPSSAAGGLLDTVQVALEVADQDALGDLPCAHRLAAEQRRRAIQLLVAQGAHRAGRRLAVAAQQVERLLLGAVGVLLRVLGVALAVLPRGDGRRVRAAGAGAAWAGDRRVCCGDMMRDDAARPVLAGALRPPLLVGAPFDGADHLLVRLLEALRQLLS